MKSLALIAALAFALSGCALFQEPAPDPEGISYNESEKIEAAGIVIPTPEGTPFLVIGSFGIDRARTPAVYRTEETLPLQARYREYYENGQPRIDATDGNTSCGTFEIGASTEVQDTEAGLTKLLCIGLGGQDVANQE